MRIGFFDKRPLCAGKIANLCASYQITAAAIFRKVFIVIGMIAFAGAFSQQVPIGFPPFGARFFDPFTIVQIPITHRLFHFFFVLGGVLAIEEIVSLSILRHPLFVLCGAALCGIRSIFLVIRGFLLAATNRPLTVLISRMFNIFETPFAHVAGVLSFLLKC